MGVIRGFLVSPRTVRKFACSSCRALNRSAQRRRQTVRGQPDSSQNHFLPEENREAIASRHRVRLPCWLAFVIVCTIRVEIYKIIMPILQILLSLLFFLMMLNTLLLNQCLVREQTKHPRTDSPFDRRVGEFVKLAIVLPYPALNRSTITDSMQRWQHIGSPCMKKDHTGVRRMESVVDLIFYVNTLVNQEDHDLVQTATQILGHHADCFSRIRVIGADLKGEEDVYPAGPSNMFFKIYHDKVLHGELGTNTHMFWMEHDVTPLRPGWVDVLVHEAAKGGFWISGSVYLGDGLDAAVQVPSNWNWVGHINGNALYDLRDDAFCEYLRLVVQYEPPNHFWKPFDVSIWRVLHAFPYTWPLYQKYREKFVYSDFINHWGFHVSNKDLEFSTKRSEVYLLHGANFSAGNLLVRPKPVPPDVIWNDRVLKSTRLSIMVRSFIVDLHFCFEAVMSAIKFVPDALEIVIIVPKEDVPAFQQHFNSCSAKLVRIIGEEIVLDDQHVQQKWSKLHADKYCSGNLILHLDSDVVFNRELELRDLLWLGKPVLVYQRYETLEAAGQQLLWQEGTSYALGAPVYHEFSRSPLHVYPRHFYASARRHLETVHMTDVTHFLRGRRGQHMVGYVNASLLFSDFNYMGAFAWKHARKDFALAPMDTDERRLFLLPPPIIQPPLCQGNARQAITPKLVKVLLKALRDIWTGGLPCNRMPDLSLVPP